MSNFPTIFAGMTPPEACSVFLSCLIFTPIIGGILLFASAKLNDTAGKFFALLFSFSTLFFGILSIPKFLDDGKMDGMFRILEVCGDAGFLGIQYKLGMSGFGLILVLLTGIVTPFCIAAAWKVEKPKNFCALLLLTQGAALGVFLSQNFFQWFLFWELSLFPAFFLIKLWGGKGAARAAYQFVLYTIGGSAFMLLAFAAIFAATKTLDFPTLHELAGTGELAEKLSQFGEMMPMLVFFGVLLGFAVKVPLFPFHTWLPDTYAEAPTPCSMFLTAVLSKMGLFGFVAILGPLFLNQLHAMAPVLIWLALAGVVLGAFAALRQTDIKRMLAYSSINHLSYCLLALFALYIAEAPENDDSFCVLGGIILQMFNHGISASALFFCFGILEERAGTRGINDFGGVRKVAPVFAALCGISLFSSLGLPGLNGFVGEFLIFRGTFALAPMHAAIATLGLLATAIFLLTFWQKVFHGPAGNNTAKISDLSLREILALAPIVALMFIGGIFPQLFINLFK